MAVFADGRECLIYLGRSAIFIGILSTDPDIHRIAISLDSADADTIGDFAINRFDITAPIPEPGTLALLAFGVVGLLGYGWRRRQRAARKTSRRPGAVLFRMVRVAVKQEIEATAVLDVLKAGVEAG